MGCNVSQLTGEDEAANGQAPPPQQAEGQDQVPAEAAPAAAAAAPKALVTPGPTKHVSYAEAAETGHLIWFQCFNDTAAAKYSGILEASTADFSGKDEKQKTDVHMASDGPAKEIMTFFLDEETDLQSFEVSEFLEQNSVTFMERASDNLIIVVSESFEKLMANGKVKTALLACMDYMASAIIFITTDEIDHLLTFLGGAGTSQKTDMARTLVNLTEETPKQKFYVMKTAMGQSIADDPIIRSAGGTENNCVIAPQKLMVKILEGIMAAEDNSPEAAAQEEAEPGAIAAIAELVAEKLQPIVDEYKFGPF